MLDHGRARGTPGHKSLRPCRELAAILVGMSFHSDHIAIGQLHRHLKDMADQLRTGNLAGDQIAAIGRTRLFWGNRGGQNIDRLGRQHQRGLITHRQTVMLLAAQRAEGGFKHHIIAADLRDFARDQRIEKILRENPSPSREATVNEDNYVQKKVFPELAEDSGLDDEDFEPDDLDGEA